MQPLTNCEEFAGCKSDRGYGKLRHKGKCVRAHRLAYCLSNGLDIDDIKGLSVMHSCDNPSCVNPDHLILGTHKDNMTDKMSKGRHVAPQGEAHGQSKLTDDDVVTIKQRYKYHCRKNGTGALAKEFDVHPSTVRRALFGESWAHIGSVDLDKEGEGRALLN